MDANHNGISSSAELHTLAEYGVQSIELAYTNVPGTVGTIATGTYTKVDGSQANAIDDQSFQADFGDTKVRDWVEVTPEIGALPELRGYGNVYDLRQAMARDAVLVGLVQAFIGSSTMAERNGLVEQIIFRWAGSDGVDPHSRDNIEWNTQYDARKLVAMESFAGHGFVQPFSETGYPETNPIFEAVPLLEDSWANIFNRVYAELTVQTHLADLFGSLSYSWDMASQRLQADFQPMAQSLQLRYAADPIAATEQIVEVFRCLAGSGIYRYGGFEEFAANMASLGPDVAQAIESQVQSVMVPVNFSGTENPEFIIGKLGGDFLSGNGGDDRLDGWTGDDYLDGGDGNDILNGESGNDYLSGGNGNDTLNGGVGNDTMEGSAGNDIYPEYCINRANNTVSIGYNRNYLETDS